MTRVKILNPQTIEYPDGTVAETASRPTIAMPRDGLYWHDALCRYVDRAVIDAPPFYVDLDAIGDEPVFDPSLMEPVEDPMAGYLA